MALILLSILLLVGVRKEIRGLMLPWLYTSNIAILFQIMYGLWMIFGYYIYLEMVFAALCNWTWMSLNIYCIWVVKSHLKNVQMKQSPDIEYYNDVWTQVMYSETYSILSLYTLWNIHLFKSKIGILDFGNNLMLKIFFSLNDTKISQLICLRGDDDFKSVGL